MNAAAAFPGSAGGVIFGFGNLLRCVGGIVALFIDPLAAGVALVFGIHDVILLKAFGCAAGMAAHRADAPLDQAGDVILKAAARNARYFLRAQMSILDGFVLFDLVVLHGCSPYKLCAAAACLPAAKRKR